MKQDSMVIEYRGERLRRTVADARERRYRAAGKDCYLFNVNDDTVVDATMKGAKGRFTVRSSPLALPPVPRQPPWPLSGLSVANA